MTVISMDSLDLVIKAKVGDHSVSAVAAAAATVFYHNLLQKPLKKTFFENLFLLPDMDKSI